MKLNMLKINTTLTTTDVAFSFKISNACLCKGIIFQQLFEN